MNGMENLFKTDFDPSQTSFKSNVKIGNDDNWTYTGMVDKHLIFIIFRNQMKDYFEKYKAICNKAQSQGFQQ